MRGLDRCLPRMPEGSALLVRLLREELLPRRRLCLAAALLMALAAGGTAASAWLVRDVVNDIFFARRADQLAWLSAAVSAIFVFKGVCDYGARVLLGRLGNAISASLRRRFYAHLLRQELMFFVNANSPELIARLIRQVDATRAAIELVVSGMARDLLTLVGLILVMLTQQPLLFTLALPSAVLVLGLVRLLASRAGGLLRQEHDADVALIGQVMETAQGIRSIKAFDLGPRLEREFAGVVDASERRSNRIQRLWALPGPLTEAVGGLAIAAVIFHAGWQSIEQGVDPGAFTAFTTALLLAYDPARRISQLKLQLEGRLALAGTFYQFLDRQPALTAATDSGDGLPAGPVPVTLERVSFGYHPGAPPVLDAVDLCLRPGRVTALCGPSGSGKSTLVDLLFRFHDPWRGRVCLGGRDLREWSPARLNACFAYVGQDAFLFDASIEDNLRLGAGPDVDSRRLAAALRAAALEEVVAGLPDGLRTRVGELGGRLSGGQRQRLALARALVRDAPILVLDEATSALDPGTERRVLDALRRHGGGRTLLLVSHRLAPLACADWIVVLEAGRVVEQGEYAALAAAGGPFARLHGFGPRD